MLAKKNEVIKEAAETMYAVSAEENIRLQCEARRRYEEDRVSLFSNGKIEGEKIGRELGRQEGKKIGKIEGESRMARLIVCLQKDHKEDCIGRMASDPEYRNQLYAKYDL